MHGKKKQIAHFRDTSSIEGFSNLNEGIVLSTGNAKDIFLNYQYLLSTDYSENGDADLENGIADYETYDAVAIEFDAISTSDKISFQYIFASEEFDQDTEYNDVFALYVNGENIAQIPGSNDVVSMESLRTRNPQYYYKNRGQNGFGFLGYSTLLSCQATVTPGAVNKFKLVIADVSDDVYDSAVLIKANSISNQEQPPMEINPEPPPIERDPEQPPIEINPEQPGEESEPLVKIEKEVSKVELTTADGRLLHSIRLDSGQSLDELKQAFIADGIYLIVDNEMLQGACIKIEYKIKIKNESILPCTELLIRDYLDSGLVCMSDEWNKGNNNVLEFHKSGDIRHPVIRPKGKFETVLEATRLLTFNSDKFEFNNEVEAIIRNRQMDIATAKVKSQSVSVIPPFGTLKKENIFKRIGTMTIISMGLFIIANIILAFFLKS